MLGLGRQQQPLRHAKTVLLVDHRQPEVLVGDLLLEDRVGADQDIDRAVGEAHQDRFARLALLAPGEDRDPDAEAVEHAEERRMVLSRQNLCRGEQGRLRLALDRGQHRGDGDQRLARSDIALEKAEHRHLLLQVAFDLADRACLRAGRRIRKPELVAQPSVALEWRAFAAALIGCPSCKPGQLTRSRHS